MYLNGGIYVMDRALQTPQVTIKNLKKLSSFFFNDLNGIRTIDPSRAAAPGKLIDLS